METTTEAVMFSISSMLDPLPPGYWRWSRYKSTVGSKTPRRTKRLIVFDYIVVFSILQRNTLKGVLVSSAAFDSIREILDPSANWARGDEAGAGLESQPGTTQRKAFA
jgi:hypothetical protein